MSGRFGSAARPLAAVALVAAATIAVGVVSSPAHAVAPTFTTVPTRLYMVPAEHTMTLPAELAGLVIPTDHIVFDDVPTPDVISRQSRIITVNSTNTPACDHHAPDLPEFSLTGCTTVKLTVNPSEGLLRFVPDPSPEDDPRFPLSMPRIQMYRFASGALLQDVDDPAGFEGGTLSLIGTAAEINETLKTLRFTPTVDDPSTEEDDEDYYYTGLSGEGQMEVAATNFDGTTTATVQIRVLDYNNFPAVDVPQDQWTIADPNSGADLPLFSPNDGNPPANPTVSVTDEDNDEVADPAQDGDDVDSLPGDGDDPDDGAGDEFLVIAWTTCGEFSLISSNGFDIGDDLEHVFDYVYDQFGDPSASDPADREMLEEALRAALPDSVEQLPFANTDPSSPTTALVAVANNINDVNYNLGRITFHPVDAGNVPLQNTTCKLRVLVSDLGNNGLPIQYLGDPPSGLEIPMFGVDFDTNYVPTVEELTITIGNGGAATPEIVAVSDVTQAEGDGGPGATPFTFTLTLDQPAVGGETVQVSTSHSNGSILTDLTDDTDFTPLTNQTVTFAAGASSATFTVPVNGDISDEDDENFELLLSSPMGVTIGDDTGLGTVQDDDPDPGLQIVTFADVTEAEGDAGPTAFDFTIGLSDPAPTGGVSVRVSTNYVTANPADLTPLFNQVVIFPQGEETRTVTVEVDGDLAVEPTETFTATLSEPVGASIAAAAQSATGTITNDDFRTVSIDDVTMAEGDAGTTNFNFTVSLNGPAVGNESVFVSTVPGGTATSVVDYAPLVLVPVTFLAGETSKQVTVQVQGDPDDENDETFFVQLSGQSNLIVGDGTGTGTIQDDDDPVANPTVTIADVSLDEGDAGTTPFTFTLTLDIAPTAPVSVDVATAFGTATVGDFTALPTTTVTFAIGDMSEQVTVDVTGDPDFEPNEAFTLGLTNPQGLLIGDASATGTIVNDDAAPLPVVSVNDVTMAEGNAGTTAFTFTVSLDMPATAPGSVDVATALGTADAVDFSALPTTTIPFAIGDQTKPVTVLVNGDPDVEGADTFLLNLSNAQGLVLGDASGTGTIQNDDGVVAEEMVSIADVTLPEGNLATTSFVFTLSLNEAAEGTESVTATVTHGSTDATDLTPTTASVPFASGQSSATFTVNVNGDTTPEPDDTFTVTLSAPVGLVINDGAAAGTIENDDLVHITSINDPALAEGNAGTTNFVFTLTLDAPAVGNESVVATSSHGGGALDPTDDTDFLDGVVPVVFVAGQSTATATVAVNGDPDIENDENFTLTLSSPQNVIVDDDEALATVQNDDGQQAPPQITSVTDVTMDEGDVGTTAFTFTLTLDQPAAGDEAVDVSTVHVETDDNDLTPLTAQTVTFAASATTATVTVLVDGDLDVETDEDFTLTLANPVNVTIGDNMATGTIVDDDAIVQPPSPLTITVPADITVPNDPGQPGAVVNYPAPTTNGGVPPVTVTCSSPSGGFYPIGVTTVTCTATDSDPNPQQQLALAIASDSFTITVVDTTPPSTTTPPDSTAPPVTPPATPPASTNNTAPDVGQLPATGGDSGTPLAIAAVTCLAGVALLLIRRRTRPAS